MGELIDGLPRPAVSVEEATRLALELFGVVGKVDELGSQQDRNFVVTDANGARFLLKINNPACGRDEVEAQNAAMLLLSSAGVQTPHPVVGSAGTAIVTADLGGVPHVVRLLTFVDGIPLIESHHVAESTLEQFGTLVGRVSAVLATFNDPGLNRELQWELRRGSRVVAELLPAVRDPLRRSAVEAATAASVAALAPLADRLPVQALHGDLTDDNVVGHVDESGRLVPAGVIDFGDTAYSWRVAELAIACTAVFHHDPDRPLALLPLIAGFDAQVRLTDAEIEALWPLIVLRGATLVVSGEQQVAIDPGNDYAESAMEREWLTFDVPARFDARVATAAIRHALGRPVTAPAGWADTVPLIATDNAPGSVEFGYGSRALRDGEWLSDPFAAEDRVLARAAHRNGVAHTRFCEPRLTRVGVPGHDEPRNVALAVDVALDGTRPIVAPVDGLLNETEGVLTLHAHGMMLVLEGVDPLPGVGDHIGAGVAIGSATERFRMRYAADGACPPDFVRASELPGWKAVACDPTSLLGLPTSEQTLPDATAELARRADAYAPLQSHYYAHPPQIERGWREHLIDTNGRHYLDMINNVAVLGHGHPRVADAAADQWRMLNTNSRFHYAAIADFSERLLGTLPAAFDTVLLVNSGTEAVDLALRLARAYTGRDDVLCLSESYHGWSVAADAVSTSVSDNPQAEETRPSWAHVVPTPNAYRGRHRGPGAGAAYAADAVAEIERLTASGTPIGAFIAEPRQGNAGAIEVPAGYLAAVYAAVRSQGGVAISDEVQVGYGRQGDVFWGFQQHPGVAPDIITSAKAMGNGHPLGAVITRSEIAASLAAQGTFFSSAGGSTLSARLGSEIFDVIAEEGLQENARVVGAHLVAELKRLAQRHPVIGAVHGRGLYLGIELVRDRVTLEPATALALALCDRMRELGVIVQPTGDRQNILKVKPPLCITIESANTFIAALDEALSRGW